MRLPLDEASLVTTSESEINGGASGRSVLVVFEFSDGAIEEQEFLAGQTVEVLKAHLCTQHGIRSMADVELYFDGARMIDPLSLNDFDSLGDELRIAVELPDDDEGAFEGKGK